MKKNQFERYIKQTKGKCLDIGCGDGWMGREMMRLNPSIEMYGVDLYPEKNKENYKKIYSGNILNLQSIVNEKFDSVICFHILEHIQLDKLNSLVKGINKILKVDGIVIIETPHPITKYMPKKFFSNFWDDPTHVKPYTANELEKMFYDNGFMTLYKGFDQVVSLEMGETVDRLPFLKKILCKIGILKGASVYVGRKIADKDDL